jgi:hypothetical protein
MAIMNGSLIDDLMGQMQGAPLGQIAQQLGTDPATASNAIAAALPTLVGALGHNAQQPGGADALFNALQRDHSGQGAMDLGGLLGSLAQGGAGGGAGGLGGLLGGLLGGVMGRRRAGQPGRRATGRRRHPGPHLRRCAGRVPNRG